MNPKDELTRTGRTPASACGWGVPNPPVGEELSALVERLERLMEPDYIAVWLRKPVPALDDEKSIDLLGRGDYLRVARLISELESPTAA